MAAQAHSERQPAIVSGRVAGDAMSRREEIERAIQEIGPGRAIGQVAMLADNVSAAMSTLLGYTARPPGA